MSVAAEAVSPSTRKKLVRRTRSEIVEEWKRLVPASTQLQALLDELADAVVHFLDEQYDQTFSILSHDLRNPLGTIELSATLLLAQLADDSPARAHLELIHGSAQRMDGLIGELLATDRPK